MDWSNEISLMFLEYYENEVCLWNPKDKHHKDKKKVADAWARIAVSMSMPVDQLKKRKKDLWQHLGTSYEENRSQFVPVLV